MSVRLRLPSLGLAGLVVAAIVNGCGVEQRTAPQRDDVIIRAQKNVEAIQGGTVDNTSSNVVGILINVGGGVAICTGSLIAPNLVLTAHHCVANDGPGDIGNCNATGHFGTQLQPTAFRVTMNTTAPASVFQTGTWPSVDNSTWFGVSAVATSGSSICGGDMAVLRLSTNINSVCPLIPRVDSAVTQSEPFTAVGFGATSQSQTAPAGTRYTLNGYMSVECPSNCGPGFSQTQEWYGLSSATNRGVCEGDSGGPALDSQRRIIGTVSRGSAAACNEAVYESVFGLSTWIKQQAASAATAGGYTAAGWVTGGSTSVNTCTGVDGGTGGGGGGAPVGGGGGGGGVPVGGGGGGTGTCPSGQACFDISQAGSGPWECLTSAGGIPTSAPTCSATQACPGGSTCFATMMGATTGVCLVDCGGAPVGGGGGGGTPVGGGGGATGGGTGGGAPTMGSCTQAGTLCIDASGMGDFACIDPNTSSGIPANAPTCSQTMACPGGSSCWGTPNGNFCLQDCTTGGTGGGGGGAPVGGGTGGAGGGLPTGGGTGGAGGGIPVGGGTGGGVTGGGTGGSGGGTGGGATGGGTGGGTTDGGTGGGATGGSAGGGTGAGNGGFAGGFMFPGLPERPKPTGCSCTEVPLDALALALSGMLMLRRRRKA